MKLESMWVHGLRRFGGDRPIRVRFDEPLVCLVGANEVGKSTLLDALEMASGRFTEAEEWEPIDRAEWTRGETLPADRVIVRLRYRLSKDEQKMLRNLESGKELRHVRWLERILRVDGVSEVNLEPAPARDKEPRWALARQLREVVESDAWPPDEETEGTPSDPSVIAALLESLESSLMKLGNQLSSLDSLANQLEEEEREQGLIEAIRRVREIEARAHPHEEGRQELRSLIPRFVRFEASARQLADEYELTSAVDDPPAALHNLIELARLDLRALLDEIEADLTGSARARLEEANEILRQAFAAWSQKPPVTASFDRSGTSLLVHVRSGDAVPMKPRERSEGLRQFVALVALTAGEGHEVPPILLIDEAEMHLHYDAQADLMETLARQTTVGQIIYTTHSSACLPEDLGSSVRVVRGVGETMRSEVNQQFWSEDPGLVSLLLAMGAGSMAFVPLRPAVIAEGPSDLILLPSLIKEAIRKDRLGYQVVPGAAQSPPTRIAGLDLSGIRTIWILDGDQGGKDRRKFLFDNGIPEDRLHLLSDHTGGFELEDLIRPSTYVKAVNAYVDDLSGEDVFEEPDLLPEPCGRHDSVIAWCKKNGLREPGKPAIANKVLALRGDEPLCDPGRQKLLRDLHKTFREQLGLP